MMMNPKNFIFILMFLLINNLSIGQIIYEGTHNDNFKTFQMDNGDIKYTKYDKSEQTVSVYNLDNTKWKSVQLPLPKHHTLDEIKSISMKLFNSDTLMELAYSCVEYQSTQNIEGSNANYLDIRFTLNIINEKGEMILKSENSTDLKIIESHGVKKLLIYKHVGQGFNKSGQIDVYSLPENR